MWRQAEKRIALGQLPPSSIGKSCKDCCEVLLAGSVMNWQCYWEEVHYFTHLGMFSHEATKKLLTKLLNSEEFHNVSHHEKTVSSL